MDIEKGLKCNVNYKTLVVFDSMREGGFVGGCLDFFLFYYKGTLKLEIFWEDFSSRAKKLKKVIKKKYNRVGMVVREDI